MATDLDPSELRMDPDALYREDTISDRQVGTIRVLTPVRRDGSPDGGRPVLFVGEAQLLTAAGVLPLAFEIDATTLAEAVERFAAGAAEAVERTRQQIEELRREAASSIVVPGRTPGGLGGIGGAGGLGGLPGGGQIRLR
jgi:hypothetical protein